MHETAEVFGIGDAAAITGVSIRRLIYWHQRGLLVPSVAGPEVKRPRPGARGRRPGGPDRRYSRDDLLVAVVIRELLASGVSLQRIRRAVAALRARFGDRPLHQALTGARFRLVVSRSGKVGVVEQGQAWEVAGGALQGIVALDRTAREAWTLIREWRARKHVEARLHEGRVKRELERRKALRAQREAVGV